QLSFRLWQPERHAHLAELSDGRHQRHLCVAATAGQAGQLPESQVTARLQRTHLQLVGQGKRSLIASLRCRKVSRNTTRGDLAEETECTRLISALTMRACRVERRAGLIVGDRRLTDDEARLGSRYQGVRDPRWSTID